MQTVQIPILGMTCGGCSSKVTKALSAVNGVDNVIVSLPDNIATVQYDEKLTILDLIKTVIIDLGYSVDLPKNTKPEQTKGCCS